MKLAFIIPLTVLLMAGCATQKPAPTPPGPTIAEIQAMVNAHVGDSVIITEIQNSNARYYLTAQQIIALKNAGVSDAVINAMLNTLKKPVPPAVEVQYVYPAYSGYGPWGGWGPYYYSRWPRPYQGPQPPPNQPPPPKPPSTAPHAHPKDLR
jgi:hypothetical protein